MEFKQYDTVRIVDILNADKKVKSEFDLVAPKAGDSAAIVEVYTNPTLGYELECSDKDGITQWLVTFEASEIKMELA